MRLGPALTSLAYAIVVFLVIWGAAHGRGPFFLATVQDDPMAIQLFLSSVAVLLLLLAAAIEERREAERRLRGSEELFSTAFRQGPDAIAITRARDGSIIEANQRWLELLGYPANAQKVAALGEHLSPSAVQVALLHPLRERPVRWCEQFLLGHRAITRMGELQDRAPHQFVLAAAE